ncbi:glycosyltransferase [Zhaonella formicivorans]|uniref:glycosyltransferase n=1 Tax=Zhaonella formicivorans TaxID=2528593 RepID=UPI0010DACDCC|nr:glycosyltransferase family 2 protein [Zhaonella formicivorans]
MNKKPTVSLCMIAKDEEEMILKSIKSVQHLVEEIIVVDTGSQDRTPELAAQAGALLFHYPWNQNFAHAKNYALEQASSEWILVLDCDEVLQDVSTQEFARLLSCQEVEGFFLQIKSFLGDGQEVAWDQAVRLFRNKPEYRFRGAIHEQVTSSILEGNRGRGLVQAPLIINHYGYLDTQLRKKDKFKRNTLIIKRELIRQPDDPFLLYCLALEHYQRDEVDAGLVCLEKAIKLMRGTEGYFQDAILIAALGYFKLGRIYELCNYTSKALEVFPEHPDLLLLRGIAFLSTGRCLEAAADLNKALEAPESKVIPDCKILSLLGDAYNLAGHYQQAVKAYLAALSRSPGLLYPLTQVLGIMQSGSGRCYFNELCRFTTVAVKKAIGLGLIEAGEIPLALVILLLSLYHLLLDDICNQELVSLSETFLSTLFKLANSAQKENVINYVMAAGKEMRCVAAALYAGLDCSLFPAKKQMRLLLEQLLLLCVHEICAAYAPSPYNMVGS